MKNVLTCMVFLCWILSMGSLFAAGVVLTKQTPSESEAYWKPIEFGSIENYPTSVVITPKGTKQTSTITRYQIGVVIEFVDLNATSIVSEDQFNKFKAARDSLAGYASQCKQAADILSAMVQNYDQVLRYYADGNVLIAGKWISKHDYEAKLKADQLAATAGSIPEVTSGGKTFKNVRVTKVVGDRISIMHEGGIASLHGGELAEDVRMKLEIAFPKHFHKKPQNGTSNSSVKVVANNDKAMTPDALPGLQPSSQPQSQSDDGPAKANSSAQPKPLPALEDNLEAARLEALAQAKSKERYAAMMSPNLEALNEQKPKVLEAVELIKSKIATAGTDFSFAFDTGMMSFTTAMPPSSRYSFPLGSIDPKRIYLGEEYSFPIITIYTHDDESFIMYSRLPVRAAVLRPRDSIDAIKLSKALFFLASIYNTYTDAPEEPTSRMERLLGKFVYKTYKVREEGGIISLIEVRKRTPNDLSPKTTVISVKLLDLDPERFTIYQKRNDDEFEASVDLQCVSGKQATIEVTEDGNTQVRTTERFDLWCLNRHDAKRVLEDIIKLCIKAGWHRGSF